MTMAKKKTVKKQKPARKVRLFSRGLDGPGLAYARLLADPCNAPLAHPVYSGTEGGYLVRTDSFFSHGVGPGVTAGCLIFTPGLLSGSGGSVVIGGAADSVTPFTPSAVGTTRCPGYTFLTNTASVARCVAACLKVTYPGTESGRSGRIHYGQVSGGIINTISTFTADEIAQMLPNYERTPAGCIELIWKPNDADQLFIKPGSSINDDSAKNNKCASLAVAFAGLPAATGLTFHFTAVWEWQPAAGQGLSEPNLSRSQSSNTLDQVVNYLQNAGYTFMRSTAIAAGRTIGAGALAAAYGMMAPGGDTMTSRRLM